MHRRFAFLVKINEAWSAYHYPELLILFRIQFGELFMTLKLLSLVVHVYTGFTHTLERFPEALNTKHKRSC